MWGRKVREGVLRIRQLLTRAWEWVCVSCVDYALWDKILEILGLHVRLNRSACSAFCVTSLLVESVGLPDMYASAYAHVSIRDMSSTAIDGCCLESVTFHPRHCSRARSSSSAGFHV